MTHNNCCPLCGGTNLLQPYPHADLPVLRCSCGLVFIYPHPTAEELRTLYNEEYYRSWGVQGEDEGAPRLMKHRTFASRLRMLSRHMAPGSILDVGCATGYFLEVAQEAGWDVHGVELSDFSAQLARKKFGDRVFPGTLEQAAFPPASFDVVSLSDLLEHVPAPELFLREVRRILKPDGSLVIVTPDVSSLSARLMKEKWSHFKVEHLYYFSPATIKRLLTENGFAPVAIESAPKFLNLAYIVNQFAIYRHPLLTPLTRLLDLLLPARLKRLTFPILCGEMLVLARKC